MEDGSIAVSFINGAVRLSANRRRWSNSCDGNPAWSSPSEAAPTWEGSRDWGISGIKKPFSTAPITHPPRRTIPTGTVPLGRDALSMTAKSPDSSRILRHRLCPSSGHRCGLLPSRMRSPETSDHERCDGHPGRETAPQRIRPFAQQIPL